ncbi:MAG TPA: flagellar biosynthesis protein FlhA [Pirellulales bacterium]|nr:flagellar biosynthesis protein FlhA [Pirellulales bacterium]
MPPGATSGSGLGSALARSPELILPLGIVASVLVIMVPMPVALMDVLLAANISVAVIMLLTTIYVRTPLEFSVFPSLLLATTLGRLVLNVAVTRLILTRAGSGGLDAAGGVVRSFGEFVAGDKVVVGLILFAIIVIIQFVVITKGATRISEVAARFALDGMPGRQMAIDADLNAGAIDRHEAQRRRDDITRQADFFGAMDGASKFIRGDAIAGVVITLINIVGGLFIGVIEDGMTIAGAAALFTKLTIGDGLVSQVPALLISLAAGLLVTRSTNEVNLPAEFLNQLFSRPKALAVTGAFLGTLVFTNLPTLPLLGLGAGCIGFALTLSRKQESARSESEAKANEKKSPEERIEDYLVVDPMEIEIGVALIRLADPKRGGDLLERVRKVRQSIAADIGILVPKVRIRDNLRLDQNAYRIKVADATVAEALLYPNLLLAIETGSMSGGIKGIATLEPAFNTPAVWIEPGQRDQAERLGYSVVEPQSVLATHLTELVRKHADEILTRDATKHLIDELKKGSPAVVDELIPAQMKLAEVQQILQMLLREQVSIRQLGPILETLGDHADRTKDPVLLTEQVRCRLARAICSRYRDDQRRLRVVTLDPALENQIGSGFEQTEQGMLVRMSPQAIEATCRTIAREIQPLIAAGHPPVVLVSPRIRAALRQLTAPHLPRLHVLSYSEVTRDTRIEAVGEAVRGEG